MTDLIKLTLEDIMNVENLGQDHTVNDWPWGRKERCRMRFWIESTQQGERFVRQSSKGGHVYKPKKSTFTTQATLIRIDDKIGHVEWNVNYRIFGVTMEDSSYSPVTFFDDEALALFHQFFANTNNQPVVGHRIRKD